MRQRFFLLVFFVMIVQCAQAQDDVAIEAVSSAPSYDSLRSRYIKTYPDHFFIWPVLKQRRLGFDMRSVANRDNTLKYKSNKPYSFGFGVYIFELGVELAFAIPMDAESKRIYGQSDASDIQLNIIGKKWGIDAYVQKYSGFYIEDPNVKVVANQPYPQRADIDTRNNGININYTFNNKKFSFRSAYNFIDRQLQSAGSFLLFATVNGFKVAGDSAILGKPYNGVFGDASRINKISVTSLGVAPGYTYSLIYKGFFLNGTLAFGPSHNWLSYSLEDGGTKHDIKFDGYLSARIGIGYNGDRFFGGMNFISQGRTARFDNLELVNSNSTFKVLIGYRFGETGVLEKRVWDIPRQLMK
jgi:hypothetical protein